MSPTVPPRRKRISSGSRWEQIAGYSRAIITPDIDGDWVFVSGTTGYDYKTNQISSDVVEQTRQTFRNIASALHHANASLDDVVRIRVYLKDAQDFDAVAPIVGEHMRGAKPANTTVTAGFVSPEILVEIEVTARLPRRPDRG
jgi:enamine deaminase RidA (YjgF/YER057c/UK114 family)